MGPDAAGATSESLLQRRRRRGQAAAPLAFSEAYTQQWKRASPPAHQERLREPAL
jgi:hypothetical protein